MRIKKLIKTVGSFWKTLSSFSLLPRILLCSWKAYVCLRLLTVLFVSRIWVTFRGLQRTETLQIEMWSLELTFLTRHVRVSEGAITLCPTEHNSSDLVLGLGQKSAHWPRQDKAWRAQGSPVIHSVTTTPLHCRRRDNLPHYYTWLTDFRVTKPSTP